ncbi:MAG: N-acetylmuramoyl-L-alanine amidase [Kiritimatiellia bacterium]
MTGSALLLAVTIAFPAPRAKLPYLTTCYMSGAVERGVTNLTVQGRPVAIYRTGAWVTMLDLVEGTNTVAVTAGAVTSNHVFYVAARPVPASGTGAPVSASAPEKPYAKLPYAGDVPVPHPYGKMPSEITIYLDPGHGGADPGTLSPHAFPEKEANLRVAREVRRSLAAKGYNVVMTRDADVPVVLTERARAAHVAKADAFVSIHHNAPGFGTDPRTVRYHAVYFWNPLGAALARSINVSLANALADDIPSEGTRQANFAVTRSPEIPSVLIEVDFITTPQGEADCWNWERRRRVGEAIAAGIDAWCKTPSASAAGEDPRVGSSSPPAG